MINLLAISFSWWMVVAPLAALQYGLAIVCMMRLGACAISLKQYVCWNLLILLVFFAGSFAFLIYYGVNKKKLRPDRETQPAESLVIDAPVEDGPPEQAD